MSAGARKSIGMFAGEQEIEDDTEGIDVAGDGDRFAANLFRAREIGGENPHQRNRVLLRQSMLNSAERSLIRFVVWISDFCDGEYWDSQRARRLDLSLKPSQRNGRMSLP